MQNFRVIPNQLSQQILTKQVGSLVTAHVYYNPRFIKLAKNLHGEWNPKKKAWEFNSTLLEQVASIVEEVFGVSGLEPYPSCTLILTNYSERAAQEASLSFSRPLAVAYSRDSGATLPPDVYLLTGRIRSGGSGKNWYTIVENASFEIHHYPVACLNRQDVQRALQEEILTIKTH